MVGAGDSLNGPDFLRRDSYPSRRDGVAGPPWHHQLRGPRVYALLKPAFGEGRMDEASAVTPAADLYEAVRAWYARRNATAHYGRFDVQDNRQRSRTWFPYAELTLGRSRPTDDWIRSFEHNVERVLHGELRAVGAAVLNDAP